MSTAKRTNTHLALLLLLVLLILIFLVFIRLYKLLLVILFELWMTYKDKLSCIASLYKCCAIQPGISITNMIICYKLLLFSLSSLLLICFWQLLHFYVKLTFEFVYIEGHCVPSINVPLLNCSHSRAYTNWKRRLLIAKAEARVSITLW